MKSFLRPLLAILVLVAFSSRAQTVDEAAFNLSKGDVTHVDIGLDVSGQTRLTVTFTPEKRAEFTAFTERNLDKKVRIIVNGTVRAEPVIRQRIAGPSLQMNIDAPAEALAIAESLLSR